MNDARSFFGNNFPPPNPLSFFPYRDQGLLEVPVHHTAKIHLSEPPLLSLRSPPRRCVFPLFLFSGFSNVASFDGVGNSSPALLNVGAP